jgi:hypothetical protein
MVIDEEATAQLIQFLEKHHGSHHVFDTNAYGTGQSKRYRQP